jgi:molybdopterin molybdotransferase
MVDLENAIARVLEKIPPTAAETIPLAESNGRVLAENLVSRITLPVFDNSAMDGYAVRAADVSGASIGSPVSLQLVATIPAGETFRGRLNPGECARIFTGSPVPEGADAVVMQEDTRATNDQIQFLDSAAPGENIRKRGEDIGVGDTIASNGSIITPGLIGLLAATGIVSLPVGCKPRVALIATGSELRELGEMLSPGQIYESNRVMLAALVKRCGAVASVRPIVHDSLAATRDALSSAFAGSDIVVTSGGVSVGELDFVKAAFESLGGSLDFWKVAMRPGRPFVFGRLGGKFLLGLPGNPVSAFVTFLLLVRPFLLRWQGAKDVSLPAVFGVLGERVSNPSERRHFMRVRVDACGKIFSAGRQASHMMSSLGAADGLLDLAAGMTIEAGQMARVLRIN